MDTAQTALGPYLERLADLRFVRDVGATPVPRSSASEATVALRLRTASGNHRLLVDLRTRPLTAAQAARLVADRMQVDGWIHLAPSIPTSVQHLLARACVNFVDLAGNLFVALGDAYTAQIEGRAPVTPPTRQGLARADVQVLLAMMAGSRLQHATVRELAVAAGVSKSAAANSVNALVQHDLLRRAGAGLAFAPVGLLDTLLGLYENVLRPKLIIGRYAAAERDPVALEQRLSTELDRTGRHWSFGGHAASWRLAPHHRGDRTCLVVEDADAATAAGLRLLPKADGPVLLMRSPGPFVFDAAPTPHIVPALLAYCELLCSDDERSREAAAKLRGSHLGSWR